MRADLHFMNNLRPDSPPHNARHPHHHHYPQQRGGGGRGGNDISEDEVDALLWRLADGSPSILKEAGLPPRGGRGGSGSAGGGGGGGGGGGKPGWVKTPLKIKEEIWKPIEQMSKPPSSSRRTPSRVAPAAVITGRGIMGGGGSSASKHIDFGGGSTTPGPGGGANANANPLGDDTARYVNAINAGKNPRPSPGGNMNASSSSARTPGWDDDYEEYVGEVDRDAVFERLYKAVPSGQRKKFNFPDEAPPEGSVLTPQGGRHYSKELAEKRREIELLKAELAAREVTESAGEAVAAAAAAENHRRRTAEIVTAEGSFDSDEEEEAALRHAEAEARAALARIHGSGGGARLSSRPTDVPVTRFEDDPDFVDWELTSSYSKKPWQERLRIAEEKRALKALAWEGEVRARAAAKMDRQRQVVEVEAELERLQKRRSDILVRQRHKKAMANTKVDPKSMPRSRSPWGYTGSPGTVDNIIRSSPGVGRAFGRSYPSPSSSSVSNGRDVYIHSLSPPPPTSPVKASRQ